MKITNVCEAGRFEALIGLGLSYGITSNYEFFDDLSEEEFDRLESIAVKLAPKDQGHNKFLESIVMWLDVSAPRYWWQEFDTYRIGVTKQSESTIHTIKRTEFTQDSFQLPISQGRIDYLNSIRLTGTLQEIKNELPEGFLQRRIICTNYKVLRHIFKQRKTHKLPEWTEFIDTIYEQCAYPQYLKDVYHKRSE